MRHQTDIHYLKEKAYQDASDLDVRTFISQQFRSHPQSWGDWLFEQLDLPPDGRVLELGCGPADLWLENKQRLPAGWHLVLSDLSPGMVQTAQRRLALNLAPVHFVALNSASLPFPDNHFDAVLAFGLLDHLPDYLHSLREVRRVLKPGRRFYASAGGQAHLHELDAFIRPFLPDVHYGGNSNHFGLQNGAALLAPFFADVQQQIYRSALVFKEPEPVLAYALSETEIRERLTATQLAALQNALNQTCARQGEIRLTIEKGIFCGQ